MIHELIAAQPNWTKYKTEFQSMAGKSKQGAPKTVNSYFLNIRDWGDDYRIPRVCVHLIE